MSALIHPAPWKGESRHHAESCYGGSLGCKQATLGFIVIDDRDVLNKLAEVLPYAKMTAEAPMAIVVCGDLAKSLNGEFGKYWMLDCSAASENLLLAAEALELGAVWTAIYPEEQRIENVRKGSVIARTYRTFQLNSHRLSSTQ